MIIFTGDDLLWEVIVNVVETSSIMCVWCVKCIITAYYPMCAHTQQGVKQSVCLSSVVCQHKNWNSDGKLYYLHDPNFQLILYYIKFFIIHSTIEVHTHTYMHYTCTQRDAPTATVRNSKTTTLGIKVIWGFKKVHGSIKLHCVEKLSNLLLTHKINCNLSMAFITYWKWLLFSWSVPHNIMNSNNFSLLSHTQLGELKFMQNAVQPAPK